MTTLKEKITESKEKEKKAPPLMAFTYRHEQEITTENALVEMAKDLREVKHFFQGLTVTQAGRLRVAAFGRGGPIEQIEKNVRTIAQAAVLNSMRSTAAATVKNREVKKIET